MTATAATPSATASALRASSFLIAAPLLSGLVGVLCIVSVAETFTDPFLVAVGAGKKFMIPGFCAAIAAFLVNFIERVRVHRTRIWTVTLAGFVASAAGAGYVLAGWYQTPPPHLMAGLFSFMVVPSTLGILATAALMRFIRA